MAPPIKKNQTEIWSALASATTQKTITELKREFEVNPLVSNCLASVVYAKQILADVEDARMAERPMDLNPPAWLLMHLATAADYAAMLLGGSGVCPADWNERADTKKPVSSNRSDYPSHDDLVNHFESAYKNAADLLAKATPEQTFSASKAGLLREGTADSSRNGGLPFGGSPCHSLGTAFRLASRYWKGTAVLAQGAIAH